MIAAIEKRSEGIRDFDRGYSSEKEGEGCMRAWGKCVVWREGGEMIRFGNKERTRPACNWMRGAEAGDGMR